MAIQIIGKQHISQDFLKLFLFDIKLCFCQVEKISQMSGKLCINHCHTEISHVPVTVTFINCEVKETNKTSPFKLIMAQFSSIVMNGHFRSLWL